MTTFGDAVDAIFTDPNVGEDAVWRPAGLAEISIRVVRKQPSGIAEFGSSRAVLPAILIEVRRSEAPDVAEGDLIEIGQQTFGVIAPPLADSFGLVLTCEASEV